MQLETYADTSILNQLGVNNKILRGMRGIELMSLLILLEKSIEKISKEIKRRDDGRTS